MLMKPKYVAAVLSALMLASAPAYAEITVSFFPPNQVVDLADGTTTVDILALIPESDAIVSWGFDLSFLGTSVSLFGAAVNEPLFDAVTGFDGDPFAALAPTPPGTAVCRDPVAVLLATVTLSLNEEGVTTLVLDDDNPSDLSEGFALDPPPAGEFADVVYEPGTVTVIPEPAVAVLVGLGAVTLLRRRRTT